MRIHFLRHATFLLKMNNAQLLVDPMLSRAEALDPVKNAINQKRIPMVEFPLNDAELGEMLNQIGGVIVSHTHRDHWDPRAIELIRKDIPIFCQPTDAARISGSKFKNVTPVQNELSWEGITFHRTGGQHGKGATGQSMGPVSGFVVRKEGEPTLYIAGDTIWCPEVADALQNFTPDVVVLNAGAAAFLTGGPITMTAEDVVSVCRALPSARIVAVHMEVVNHCTLTRDELRQHLAKEKLTEQVLIPSDGEVLTF
jgi:L-ascorbate metabolism protein UlaG (beta-lactamase superfamily)